MTKTITNTNTNNFGSSITTTDYIQTLRLNGQENCTIRRSTRCGEWFLRVSVGGEWLFDVDKSNPHDLNWEVVRVALQERLFNAGCDYAICEKSLPVIVDGIATMQLGQTYIRGIQQGKFIFQKYIRESFCGAYRVIFLKDSTGRYHHVQNKKI